MGESDYSDYIDEGVTEKLSLESKLKNTLSVASPDTNDYKNYKLAESFITSCMVKDEIDDDGAKAFIKYVMADAFRFEGKLGGTMISDLTKTFTTKRKQMMKARDIAARNNCMDIPEEFNGLYTKEINSKGETVVSPYYDEIAKQIIEDLHVIVFKDCFYVYKDGKYENNMKIVEAEASRYINGILRLENSRKLANNLKDLMTHIRTYNPVSEYPFQGVRNAINVQNGVILFDECGEYQLVDPDPELYKFNYILPVTFDPDASSGPILEQIEKYSDRHGAIIQIFTQIFIQSMGYSPSKIAYLLHGPSDYGKSTILKLIREFVGKPLTCGIALNRMSSDTNNRFALAPLEGKLVNLKDELAYFKLTDTVTLKDVTGSYDVEVEPKRVDPYTAVSTAVHVFATNDTPAFDGRIRSDEAFWKRWVLIPCTKTKFVRDDTFYYRTFTSENMSGLLNEILQQISLHIQGAPWEYSNADGDKWEDVREEWMLAGNPLYKFITENMNRGGETAVIKSELLKVIQDWCDAKLLYKKARPETTNALNETIQMCGGTLDGRKYFYRYTAEEMAERIDGKFKVCFSDRMLSDETHCFIIPWTWKESSPYKDKFRAANSKTPGLK